LDKAAAEVRESVLQALKTCSYAGWSKRAAKRGAPLINVMICPSDGAADFWCVKDTSGQIKHKDWVVQLHRVSHSFTLHFHFHFMTPFTLSTVQQERA
jgi:hypothetical protein